MARKPSLRRPHKKISKKQQALIDDKLDNRIKTLLQGNALKATVISHLGFRVIVSSHHNGPLLACDWRQNIGTLCIGDRVLINQCEHNTGIIEAILPRQNHIEKQNTYRGAKPFAANIDQLLVIISHKPMLQASLLDRYIVTANHMGIHCSIYFNKTDSLAQATVKAHIDHIAGIYQKLGEVTWLNGSVKTGDGIERLQRQLNGQCTLLVGQSGVGKSSLIKRLVADVDIQTQNISAASGLGRHSTTNSTLYYLPQQLGTIIDTPGIRSFNIYHLSPSQIATGFSDIAPFIEQCRFSDCSHTHEKYCAVKEAIAAEKISQLRYDSFLQILSEAKNHERNHRP